MISRRFPKVEIYVAEKPKDNGRCFYLYYKSLGITSTGDSVEKVAEDFMKYCGDEVKKICRNNRRIRFVDRKRLDRMQLMGSSGSLEGIAYRNFSLDEIKDLSKELSKHNIYATK